MPTPLYDALRAFAEENPLRLHMPGHKGTPLSRPELSAASRLDFTELTPTGNLYEPGEPMDSAQALWADAWGMDWCQFLTGGSTQGVHTAISLCARPGDAILLDRGSHRSAYHSLALLDLEPFFLPRPWLEEDGLTGPITPREVEAHLLAHPEIKTVWITSPTYYGVLSDIWEISQVVHRLGAKLLVDGAHGAHLPFLGLEVFRGADLVVTSAHKTLPALGQGAVLLGRGPGRERARELAAVYGTSSPSYPVLASMDLARDWMADGAGVPAFQRAAEAVSALRRRFLGVASGVSLDPLRLTVQAPDGFGLARALEEQGVYPELADSGHVLFLFTGCDGPEQFARLERALTGLEGLLGPCPRLPPPPLPRRALSPRQALFAPRETLPLAQCLGRVSAGQIAPYPPGIPVVAPGEALTKKELSYLEQIGYNGRETAVVDAKTLAISNPAAERVGL